jgi:demethylmenaquinone methyltransferase/2-methoxy-6-polyprenyl-1,4-benzoquinol methylase
MNTGKVRQHYTTNARRYDLLMRPFAGVRQRAIEQLALAPGMRVLELGCGTGTSFAALLEAVGPKGSVVGVDVSRAMLEVAHEKIDQAGWTNVKLIQTCAECLPLAPATVDAVLVFYSNDVLTNPGALDQALVMLRPGGRFVIAGAKLTDGAPALLLNPLTRGYAERSIVTRLSQRPWEALEACLGSLSVEQHLGGSAFVASGSQTKGSVNTL